MIKSAVYPTIIPTDRDEENLVWLGFMANPLVGLPNPLYTYILNTYLICKHIL